MIKNIHYPSALYSTEKFDRDHFMCDNPQGEGATQSITAALYTQIHQGIRMYVEKEVSDELSKCDLKNISFSDIIWPAYSIELFFQDKELPTAIFAHLGHILNPYNEPMSYKIPNENILLDHFPDGISLLFGTSQHDNYLANIMAKNVKPWLEKELHYTHPSSPMSGLCRHLVRMITKILLYISIPQYKCFPISENTLKREGKSGVKGRPNRPLYKVIYVPQIINTDKRLTSNQNENQIKPHMRRGHFRMLRSDKYKNKQGKLVFVRPSMIHGGSINDKLYIARKST